MNNTRKFLILITTALFTIISCLNAQVISFEEAKNQADQSDARAQAIVAMHYSLGWQVPKNQQKAVEYALKSARSGEALGLFRMGTLLRNGDGVPKNEEEGLKLQLEAIKLWNTQQNQCLFEEADPYCLTAAGILIFQGKVVEDTQQNRYKAAAQFYKRAAEIGLAPAQYNYAMCLIEGHGVDKNFEDAVKYIVMSAILNYPLSIKWLQEKNTNIATATNWLKEKGVSIDSKQKDKTSSTAFNNFPSPNLTAEQNVQMPENQGTTSVSYAKTEIQNVTNIGDIFIKLPSMVEDSKMLEKISLAPIDTDVINSDGAKFITERMSKSDYIKYFAKDFGNTSLPTVKDLKQNATLYQLATACLRLSYLTEKQKIKLRSDLESDNTQYIESRPPYCATGSGDQGAWLSFASGLMLLDSSDAPAFIPREIIMSADSFSLRGKKNRYGGFEDVKALIIQTTNNELFEFPPHRSFTSLIRGMNPHSVENPINTLASAFNYHKLLINASILQDFINKTKTQVDRNAPGILSYPGILIGMDKSKCENILRELNDYRSYNGLKVIRCDQTYDLSDANVRASIQVLTDFQVASNGLVVVPPWEIFVVQPKELVDKNKNNIKNLKPLDVFIFKNDRLVFLARYPNFEGSNSLFKSFQLDGRNNPKDNSQLKAFLEKYGQQQLLTSAMFRHNSSSPSNFQIIWKDRDLRIGAIFNYSGHFNSLPQNLKPVDRVRNANNGTIVGDYGSLVPIDPTELDFSSNDKSSLRASFYWNQESALLINTTSQEYFNKVLEKQNQLQKEKSQKLHDEI